MFCWFVIKERRAADSSVLIPKQRLVLRVWSARRLLPVARGTAGSRSFTSSEEPRINVPMARGLFRPSWSLDLSPPDLHINVTRRSGFRPRPGPTTVIRMWWRPGRADRARSGLSAPNESSRMLTQLRFHRRSNSSTDQSALRRGKGGLDVWADQR